MKDLQIVLRDWEAVIGLEVHTELSTLNTKMFCSCPIGYGAKPNTHICPICLGLPGVLPEPPNKAAIESIILAGLATGCEIMKQSMFYRKNYFYPDLTNNFQLTQGPIAFCMNGHLDLEVTGEAAAERVDRTGTEPVGLDGDREGGSGSGAVGSAADSVAGSAADSVAGSAADSVAGSPAGSVAAGAAGSAADSSANRSAGGTQGGYRTRIGITRIHMEEDAGKLIHIGGTDGRITGADYSLVDYNRCGTPLIELVTEPDLRTPEEARLFLQKLRQIYLALGISDCSMEEGSLRCDGNISLRRRGTTKFGTKTELKNMNSTKNLHDGLAYEICRQAEVLESGGVVLQETRHWEPASKRTYSMRVKETADDYRYFPEPNLAPFDLSDEFIEGIRARLPELPDAKKRRFIEAYGLPVADAQNLASDTELAAFFDAAVAGQATAGQATGLASDGQAGTKTANQNVSLAKPIANLLLNDVAAWLNANNSNLAGVSFTPAGIAELARLVAEDTISTKQAREVFSLMTESGDMPSKIVEERGMRQVSDTGALEAFVETVLAAYPDKVAEYRGGKTGLLGFFVGMVMKETKGQGNPKLINKMLLKRLEG